MKKKFYVVWAGRESGIFNDWAACKASVEGFAGAQYMAFDNLDAAKKAFSSNYWQYVQKKEPKKVSASGSIPYPKGEALTVDAACSGNPGEMEYRGVWLSGKQEYFRMGPYPEGTVNIGEFLAIVHGLALMQREGLTWPVYSDSKTAMKWVKDRKANTKLKLTDHNRILFEYLERAEEWLKTHTYANVVMKWETAHWGEIPADYGRK